MAALEADWRDEPMTHRLVASFVGFKAKKKGKALDLLAMFPSGVVK